MAVPASQANLPEMLRMMRPSTFMSWLANVKTNEQITEDQDHALILEDISFP